jgi:DNA-binding NtrC family response regulator
MHGNAIGFLRPTPLDRCAPGTALTNECKLSAKGPLMPAQVVVVYSDPVFRDALVTALRLRGHEVAAFVDPMEAWDAFDTPQRIEVLVTEVEFLPGKSNGIALARMIRMRRPDTRVVFTALPEFVRQALGLGEFMRMPVGVPEVVDTVVRMLERDD